MRKQEAKTINCIWCRICMNLSIVFVFFFADSPDCWKPSCFDGPSSIPLGRSLRQQQQLRGFQHWRWLVSVGKCWLLPRSVDEGWWNLVELCMTWFQYVPMATFWLGMAVMKYRGVFLLNVNPGPSWSFSIYNTMLWKLHTWHDLTIDSGLWSFDWWRCGWSSTRLSG